ncbi:Myb-like DNA-binding domain containing protein [Trichomonas vaginalis G3]|uniref:Myb-like DNA-binding domain containing protein n=1 Tax=Trichomonas vaginalis (strain ATCC PRA-98 / G3) TaxID=412133 RepID=A2E274_TRIV3|nr:RNA polymerase II transcription regulator recruiting protein [Trichomonas vaginalis G3]EAY13288.1 Myb-like DNA-binding domain containing protein [Trichomonas vaginalis G3]KAI5494057.1 RNA polymerase II transcription regulator recruiting protein [Trichomonas vaginalis G3]|eukprot:XP_001325511.1 Myb-like DNA-binding domain containing protein [Trichomonas vaginalis G3]
MSFDAPLVRLASSYIVEVCPDIQEDVLDSATNLIKNMLSNKITYQTCSSQVYELIQNTTPVDRIHAILSVDISSPLQEDFEPEKAPEQGHRRRARPWTPEEDLRLLAGINKYGLESWGEIVKIVGNGRTRPQCSQRWFRGLDPKINKAAWSPEEDKKLFHLVSEYGTKVWSKIAAQMGSRSDVQCRYHYFQLIKGSKHDSSHRSSSSKLKSKKIEKQHSYPITDLTSESSPKPIEAKPAPSNFPTFDLFSDSFESIHSLTSFDLTSAIDDDFPFY